MKKMKIAVGCDHGALELKNALVKYLNDKGYDVTDDGTFTAESCDYPVFAKAVCADVNSGKCKYGLLCCTTGIGMSMVANKQRGIRAALITDELSAEMTRRHNDANVICFGSRNINAEDACRFADIFFNTEFEGGRHKRRVDMFE